MYLTEELEILQTRSLKIIRPLSDSPMLRVNRYNNCKILYKEE